MRKRRLRLALLAVTLFGVLVWLVWQTPSPAITAAKEKYARLQLGMSEEEVATILGGQLQLGKAPQEEWQLYGKWVDALKCTNLPARGSPQILGHTKGFWAVAFGNS